MQHWAEQPLWTPVVENIVVAMSWDQHEGWAVVVKARREGERWDSSSHDVQSRLTLAEALQLVDDSARSLRGF